MNQISSLTTVVFDNPRFISNRGVSYLSSLRQLNLLHLDGADINDDCIDFLIELRELRELSIENTGISSYGYDRLNSELPYCHVNWSPRGDDEETMADDDYYPDK